MTLFTQDMIEDDENEAGIHLHNIVNAVQCWSVMQNRKTSVAEAALTFNTTPEIIRTAVEYGFWMSLECDEGENDPAKQFIGLDGE
ncbi:hypothetical protein [Aerococcus loyolae]|uniref:Uncharacterized protein n=1 Tax=Aerococcus urinae TaxID=1376 RepID=A0A329P1H3_9LACT|nr:hypothetical protein [Aerococcus loyolae]RAV76580.1 hypothetical protein DBT54_09710 [Aerococcus loyolae]